MEKKGIWKMDKQMLYRQQVKPVIKYRRMAERRVSTCVAIGLLLPKELS